MDDTEIDDDSYIGDPKAIIDGDLFDDEADDEADGECYLGDAEAEPAEDGALILVYTSGIQDPHHRGCRAV